MNVRETVEKNIQEIQILEQTLQSLLMQKQAFQIELEETNKSQALLKNSKGDSYQLIGQILIKTHAEEIQQELGKKSELIELRIKNLEHQEEKMVQKMDKLRKDISSASKSL